MKLLRTFFYLQKIYFKQTPLQILIFYFYIWLAISFVPILGRDYINFPQYAYWGVYAVAAFALIRTILRTWIVENYMRQYKESLIVTSSPDIKKAAMNFELNDIDDLKPVATYGKANIYLATFDFYRRMKNGSYLSKQAYYTVLEIPLKRALPHILFDSKLAKKRQFKSLYLRVQRISVQGTFDQIFDTYVPQTYNIDSLSFITPEVMEALQYAKMYDIEIINDRVLLYGPLTDIKDYESFVTKGEAIANHLNDNIDTYRDNRLTGLSRTKNVTPFARALLKSPEKYLSIAAIMAAIMVDIVYFGIKSSPENRGNIFFNQLSLLIYITFISNLWQAGKILRQNKKAEERFRILYKTNRGKPNNQKRV